MSSTPTITAIEVIPVAGRWTARLDILVSDFDMVQIEAPIDIRPQ